MAAGGPAAAILLKEPARPDDTCRMFDDDLALTDPPSTGGVLLASRTGAARRHDGRSAVDTSGRGATGADWRHLTDVELYGALQARGMRPGDTAMMVSKRGTILGEILLDRALAPAL